MRGSRQVPVKPQAQLIRQKIEHSTKEDSIDQAHQQTLSHQIVNPLPAAGGIAPGKFRDQQLRQPEENSRREHDHRENHAADQTEGCKGIIHSQVLCQPLGYHQTFQGVDTGFQIVRNRQWQRRLQQPSRNGNPVAPGCLLPESEDDQTQQRQTGTYGAAQNHT